MSDGRHEFVQYRSLADLERALQSLAMRLPPSIEVVVGVPRSGLLAATILALQLNLPLTDVAGFVEGRVLATGGRPKRSPRSDGAVRAVVVDDSVAGGTQMALARERLSEAGRDDELLFVSPFVTTRGKRAVDLFAEVVELPRVFAWNILHHPALLRRSCVDIDGVLCVDPTATENDDGPRYRQFLDSAQPLFLPSVPVRYLVTSRLERYRAETERWLRDNGVEYSELVMLDLADAATRRATGAHARHKADFYKRSDADMFIESDFAQAVEIAALSGRQVFAVDRREMVYPSPQRALAAAPLPFLRSTSRIPPAQAVYWTARTRAAEMLGPRVKAAIRRAIRSR